MTTKLKIAALSLGFAVAIAGATAASADSRFHSVRDHRGHAEVRFERHHHHVIVRHHHHIGR